MSDCIKPGDRVRFRAGRGHGEGRVANLADGMATIATEGGKLVNRRLSQLERIAEASQAEGSAE